MIADQLKPDAISAIKELKAEGVKQTVMLTGDNQQVAEAAKKLVLTKFMQNFYQMVKWIV